LNEGTILKDQIKTTTPKKPGLDGTGKDFETCHGNK